MTNVVVFCHIEKCAGTSVITKLRRELPFKSCDVVARTNVASAAELRKVQRLYPDVQAISGHSIYPLDRVKYEQVFGAVTMFTVLREPLERLISHYVYDVMLGRWNEGLESYSQIPWKQNYLLRFLGRGRAERGEEGYQHLDIALTVAEIGEFLPALYWSGGVRLAPNVGRENPASSELPEDVRTSGGDKVGKYRIAPELFERMQRQHADDIAFYNSVMCDPDRLERRDMMGRLYASVRRDIELGRGDTNSLAYHAARVYRSAIYKPASYASPGYHALPRNEIKRSPGTVPDHDAFT